MRLGLEEYLLQMSAHRVRADTQPLCELRGSVTQADQRGDCRFTFGQAETGAKPFALPTRGAPVFGGHRNLVHGVSLELLAHSHDSHPRVRFLLKRRISSRR